MILTFLISLLAAVGPLLRGSWDLWAQSILLLAVVSGFGLWLLTRIAVGFVPLPSNRLMVWTGLLAILSAASAWASPVPGPARAQWFVFLGGLWIFPAMAAVGKDERTRIDQAVRAGAWVLMLLAFHEHFILHVERPTSTLLNQNVYAGAVLMLLPLALERGDWLLGIGLFWSLWWTRSAGAWLGLAGALAITQRRSNPMLSRVGMAVAVVCGVILYARLQTPEVLHRWGWWRAAWAMAAHRPLLGYGPGTFAYVLSAYRALSPFGLYSLYAHQYFLETAAGFGLPFALLWFAGLWRGLARAGAYKRFAVFAVLIQSLWDYPLSVPGLFWLFCYCAASAIPDSPRGVNVPSPRRPIAAVLVVGLGWFFCGNIWSLWSASRAAVAAAEAEAAGEFGKARELLAKAGKLNPLDAERALLEADVELRDAAGRPGDLLAAAAALEEAAFLNPYRPATWTQLARVYRMMGRDALAALVERRSERFLPR